jgi:hypothetical protein
MESLNLQSKSARNPAVLASQMIETAFGFVEIKLAQVFPSFTEAAEMWPSSGRSQVKRSLLFGNDNERFLSHGSKQLSSL